jgi:hypothetical protein
MFFLGLSQREHFRPHQALGGATPIARWEMETTRTSVDVCPRGVIVVAEALVCVRQRPSQFPLRPDRHAHRLDDSVIHNRTRCGGSISWSFSGRSFLMS